MCPLRRDPFFWGLMILTMLKVMVTQAQPCPEEFDCNSYLFMVHHWGFFPEIPSHHAMRFLPSWGAALLVYMGASDTLAFQILSGSGFIGFAGLCYFTFRTVFKGSQQRAFAFSLITVFSHEAMKIPLSLVYQSCDMWTYPIGILLILCTLNRQYLGLLGISLLAITTRQTLFVLSVFCWGYALQTPQNKPLKWAGGLAIVLAYISLTHYFQATSVFKLLLHPPEGFFVPSHLLGILVQSKLLDLWVPISPFLLIAFYPTLGHLKKYWFIPAYMLIVIGQPFLAYHMTGNNFQRLALQGVWPIYLIVGGIWMTRKCSKTLDGALLIYGVVLATSWSPSTRWILWIAMCSLLGCGVLIRKWGPNFQVVFQKNQ